MDAVVSGEPGRTIAWDDQSSGNRRPMVSTTHPDEISTRARFADAVLRNSTLEPTVVDQVWLRHLDPLPE